MIATLFVESAAKTAPVSGGIPPEVRIIEYLIFFVLIAIPLISIALSILLWKRFRFSRELTTLFIFFIWVNALIYLFVLNGPMSLLLVPTLLGIGISYFLWIDEKFCKKLFSIGNPFGFTIQ
jgi:hypothetical protein